MRGLKFVSLRGHNGYAEAARRYATGLSEAGVPLTWAPAAPGRGSPRGFVRRAGGQLDAPLERLRNTPIAYDTVLLHTVPEYYPAWAARETSKRIVGYTAWETDRPPAHWPALLNAVELVLVPCTWNREVFRAHGVTTHIEVVPHAAPSAPLPVAPRRERFGVRPEDYCFYTIDEWNARKAIGGTIDAYLRAFTRDDPVVLVVKTTPSDGTHGRWLRRLAGTRRAVRRILRRYRRPARIVLLTTAMTDAEMLQLHAAGDCYVSLTRGEGWGLGAFDAAALGRPVLMTRFGGQVEWLGAGYPFYVDHRLVAVDAPAARASYSPDQQWAEADRDHAARLMRRLFDQRVHAASVGRSLQIQVHARFNRAAVTGRLLEALS